MDKIRIRGGNQLNGKITVGGAKNAALPLMAAALLTKDTLTLKNLPKLADIKTMSELLANHGVNLQSSQNQDSICSFNAANINNLLAPYEIVRKMRASILVLGPLLARFGEAKVSLPGGCAIGARPVDLHLQALERMGAKIELEDGYVKASVKNRLRGALIEFSKVSVGATENILMAAALADGKTTIKNAAMEPEISDLAHCLNAMGAKISGIDSATLVVDGVSELHGAEHPVVYDRIEAGTFAIAAAMTGGELEIIGATPKIMEASINKLEEAGATITKKTNSIIVASSKAKLKPISLVTDPYPGLATDMQAQFMAMATIADGQSKITETIFENRFMHAPELARMGADIKIDGNTAVVTGVNKLHGTEVMATDLRASVSLVLAALVAEGVSTINRVYHLDRGYERIEEKLRSCGADIERVK